MSTTQHVFTKKYNQYFSVVKKMPYLDRSMNKFQSLGIEKTSSAKIN